MSRFLKHFTVVGDDYHSWNVNYKKWENEEDEEDKEEAAPTSTEGEGSASPDAEAGPVPTPKPPLDFRGRLRKLFSSHRFQVRDEAARSPRWRPLCPYHPCIQKLFSESLLCAVLHGLTCHDL